MLAVRPEQGQHLPGAGSGTQSGSHVRRATGRVAATSLLGGVLTFTGVGAPTANTATFPATSSTQPAGSSRPAAPAARNVPEALVRLRRTSGLTWSEIADALGVSRRAVHLWSSGKTVAEVQRRRVHELAAFVDAWDVGLPSATRIRLRDAAGAPRSPLQEFALRHRPAEVRAVATLFEQLGPVSEEAVEPLTVDRKSSLRGGALHTAGGLST